MSLVESLCSHKSPIVAFRARLLLEEESEQAPHMRKLRRAIGESLMASQLFMALNMERHNPYRKWQGPHWTLYSLAEIGFPPGRQELLPLRDRVLDWMTSPTFMKPPMTTVLPEQPSRPRRCASMEGNTIWSQLNLGIADEQRLQLLVDRLVSFQWPDGGWNCDKRLSAQTSSVQETLLPMRGLAVWARLKGDTGAAKAVHAAAEFLLQRNLLWRRSDGALMVPEWGGPVDKVHYPIRFYDVLSALLVMTEMGLVKDSRCNKALDLLETKRLSDGTFPVEWTNVKRADHMQTRGTFADWGPLSPRRGNPLVTVDASYVLKKSGRQWDITP